MQNDHFRSAGETMCSTPEGKRVIPIKHCHDGAGNNYHLWGKVQPVPKEHIGACALLPASTILALHAGSGLNQSIQSYYYGNDVDLSGFDQVVGSK
jgi:hypothetical protein